MDGQDYRKIIGNLIQKQMVVLGPDMTMAKVKKVGGINIDQKGQVLKLEEEGSQLLRKLINEFDSLSPHTTKQAIGDIEKHNLEYNDILNYT